MKNHYGSPPLMLFLGIGKPWLSIVSVNGVSLNTSFSKSQKFAFIYDPCKLHLSIFWISKYVFVEQVCSITVFVETYSTVHCHFSVSNFLQSKKVIYFYDKWKRMKAKQHTKTEYKSGKLVVFQNILKSYYFSHFFTITF